MTTLESAIQLTNTNNEKQPVAVSNQSVLDMLNTESTCSIKDVDGGDVIKLGNEIDGKDIGIVNVKNACIQLIGHPSVVHAANIENCTILCGPVSGSAFFNNLKNVKLVICCHQLRIHESFHSQFYVHLGSRAIIENCSNVEFAPYAWSYSGLADDFTHSGHNPDQSNWTCIDDFNFLKQTEKSPNWSFLKEEDRLSWTTDESHQLKQNH